jgi:Family of unknown function (DUF5706)
MLEEQKQWEGLFRGSVLSAAMSKHVSYVTSADTRAQGLIILSAALIPLAINGMQLDSLRPAAMLCMLTSLLTISLCIFCLFPKRLSLKGNRKNLLHYVEFSTLSEHEFLGEMKELFHDKEKLAEAAVRDLYHLGSKIVRPKYVFLRFAYIVCLVGQLTAVFVALLNRQ